MITVTAIKLNVSTAAWILRFPRTVSLLRAASSLKASEVYLRYRPENHIDVCLRHDHPAEVYPVVFIDAIHVPEKEPIFTSTRSSFFDILKNLNHGLEFIEQNNWCQVALIMALMSPYDTRTRRTVESIS